MVTKTLIASDIHFPFHDPNAVALTLRIIAAWQPDAIIINGDALDFYAVSTFDRDPAILKQGGLQEEIDLFRGFLADVNKVKGAGCKVKYGPGNHEYRLTRFLWRNNELFGLKALELPTLLGLEQYGVEYFSEEVELANGNLIVKHGNMVRRFGGMSAMAELANEKYAVSTITGHTHRMGFTMVRTRHHIIAGYEGGCLCNLKPEYVKNPDWHQGVTTVVEEGDHFSVSSIPYLGEGERVKAMVDGNTIRL